MYPSSGKPTTGTLEGAVAVVAAAGISALIAELGRCVRKEAPSASTTNSQLSHKSKELQK